MAPIDEERMPTLQEITEQGAEIPEKPEEPKPQLFQTVGDQVQLEDGEDQRVVEEIESLCMNCEKNGTTRLLLTRIPYFREVILMSFECPHCHLKNTEVQSAGQIQEQGSKHSLKVDKDGDLQRQVVKSDTAVFKVEDLELEVPAGRGRLTNVEGLLMEIVEDLGKDQEQRQKELPELYEKIQVIVDRLATFAAGRAYPFTIFLDDPAGNSALEPSPADIQTPGKYVIQRYDRTAAQNAALGLADGNTADAPAAAEETTDSGVDQAPSNFDMLRNLTTAAQSADADGVGLDDVDILAGQVYTLPVNCPGCTRNAEMNMQMLNIPHFKQVVISAVTCSACGYRTNEVKTGGEIPAKGKRIYLTVKKLSDLSRDILKSETCMLKVPACSVEVQPGTMGGRFTTVEGLLSQMRNDLKKSIFDVDADDDAAGTVQHDSMDSNTRSAWTSFFNKLDSALKAEFEYEVVLEDPLANSYVQSFNEDGTMDEQLRAEEYERTEEDEDLLGISDMRTKLNEHGEYVREDVAPTSGGAGSGGTSS